MASLLARMVWRLSSRLPGSGAYEQRMRAMEDPYIVRWAAETGQTPERVMERIAVSDLPGEIDLEERVRKLDPEVQILWQQMRLDKLSLELAYAGHDYLHALRTYIRHDARAEGLGLSGKEKLDEVWDSCVLELSFQGLAQPFRADATRVYRNA